MPKFLTLSTEVSEPFIIPNVSPTSSPQLSAINTSDAHLAAVKAASTQTGIAFHPIFPESEDNQIKRDREVSIIELN